MVGGAEGVGSKVGGVGNEGAVSDNDEVVENELFDAA